MAKYNIVEMKVTSTPEQMVEAYEKVIKKDDFFREYTSILQYLPYEYAHPYLREGVTDAEWKPSGNEELRGQFEHYRDWWRQKIENQRGISVERGKHQFAIRMMVAGLPEWRDLWDMDGGWYQRDAYNFLADLFGFERV